MSDNVYDDISSSSEDNDSLSNYSIVSSTEVDNRNFLHEFGNTLGCDENIFSTAEMDGLKKRELALIQRNDRGYYCCKQKHAKLYEEIIAAYVPYIAKKMLAMISHDWNTKKSRQ